LNPSVVLRYQRKQARKQESTRKHKEAQGSKEAQESKQASKQGSKHKESQGSTRKHKEASKEARKQARKHGRMVNALVLLDYDDTLIPSTKLQNLLKMLKNNQRKKEKLREINLKNRNDSKNNENKAPNGTAMLIQDNEVDIFFDNIPLTLQDNEVVTVDMYPVSGAPSTSNYPFPNDIMLELKQTEAAAVSLLSEIYLKGAKMAIISNAEIDWIWYTLNCFFPSLHNIIKSYGIIVVSARDNFEKIYKNKPELWKIACFREQLKHHCTSTFSSTGVKSSLLVSIGDSLHERLAVQTVGSEIENVNILSIKLLDTPNHDVLTKQLHFISSNFSGYLTNESKDLFVQLKDNGECYYIEYREQERQVSIVTPIINPFERKEIKG